MNPDLVAVAQQLPRVRYLVTGASGFVGSHVAKALAAAGHRVSGAGRNPYSVPLEVEGVEFARVDLAQPENVESLVADADVVIHSAALATPWGRADEYESSCVVATRNLVAACRERRLRFVHVSSTAIHFDYQDARNLTEGSPIAAPFSCEYARAKNAAETVVNELTGDEFVPVIIRARAVFGPGDNALLPRILAASDAGRLRPVGSAETETDLTYIDNLVLALLLAINSDTADHLFTITNGEPVRLWPLLEDVVWRIRGSQLKRPVPRWLGLFAARMMEWQHRLFRLPGEPQLTRYTTGLLSTTKTFDISAARSQLGYEPIVSIRDGIERTVEALTQTNESDAEATVGLRLFTTGYTSSKAHLAERGGDYRTTIRFHAMIGVIEHPEHGLTLFDTGYGPRFFDATQRWPYRLYKMLTPVVTSEKLTAVAVLKRAGIDPSDIRRIVLSHLHGDHTCGLHDFPEADVILLQRCWEQSAHLKGFAAVRRATLPDLIPDFGSRLCLIRHLHDPGFGPFKATHDLFGDGSVRLVDLSGHADGQCGILLQTEHNGVPRRRLLAADSAWTSATLRDNLPLTLPFRLLAASTREATATKEKLTRLWNDFPDTEIILTHCPEIAERYGFDQQLEAAEGDAGGKGT